MRLHESLRVPPYRTDFIAALQAISEHYGYNYSTSWIFGSTGHAFLLNIHKELCPSAPYTFDMKIIKPLIENLGIKMVRLMDVKEISQIEAADKKIKQSIDGGRLCMILNLDFQVITGYDDDHFYLAPYNPNKPHNFPMKLTFGNWHEFGSELFATVWEVRKIPPKQQKDAIRALVPKIVDFSLNGDKYNSKKSDYTLGIDGYLTWINALERKLHLHEFTVWSAYVWAENRIEATAFLKDTKALFPEECEKDLQILYKLYKKIATNLRIVSKFHPRTPAIWALKKAYGFEKQAMDVWKQVNEKIK